MDSITHRNRWLNSGTQPAQPHLRNTRNPTCNSITNMSNPNSEEKTYKACSKEEVEKLIGWMEENQEALRGLQRKWHKDVKEEVFADNENITVNRI
ncbi:hypothetical protein EV426DRAFT_699301 [Tirmania nivea]|nr:hypothetical protein EV426DRAFT_699301 [Tirmania nivea]